MRLPHLGRRAGEPGGSARVRGAGRRRARGGARGRARGGDSRRRGARSDRFGERTPAQLARTTYCAKRSHRNTMVGHKFEAHDFQIEGLKSQRHGFVSTSNCPLKDQSSKGLDAFFQIHLSKTGCTVRASAEPCLHVRCKAAFPSDAAPLCESDC